MNETSVGALGWIIPIWSAGVLTLIALWLWKRRHKARLSVLLATLAAAAAVPLFPSVFAQMPQNPPVQVVYRFDEDRYLELEGWDCEGALRYVDTKQRLSTIVLHHSFRI